MTNASNPGADSSVPQSTSPAKKSIVIHKEPKRTQGLTLQERGLLYYMLELVDANGYFQQKQSLTADENFTTQPTIHRVEKSLIRKGGVTIITPSVRGADGYNTVKVLEPHQIHTAQPTPLMEEVPYPLMDKETAPLVAVQPVETKEPPYPNGDLLYNTIKGKIDVCPYGNGGIVHVVGDGVDKARPCQPIDMAPATQPTKLCAAVADGEKCYNLPTHGEFCGVHAPTTATKNDAELLKELSDMTPYPVRSKVLRTRFTKSRLPECPECGKPCWYDDDLKDDTRWEIYDTCGSLVCETALRQRKEGASHE